VAIGTRAFYTSSNGDSWALTRNKNGDVVVRHEQNVASGGTPSEIELSSFLESTKRGPEHQALRELIGELIDTNNVRAEYDDHD
jgi:hypothetical protein